MYLVLVRTGPNRRSRIRICIKLGIQVENDTRLIPLIQASTSNTSSRSYTTTSTDLQVETLRVQLGTIIILGAVKSNNFVANDVVTSFKVLGNYSRGREVVGEHLVGDPGSGSTGGDKAGLRDLGPFKGRG